MHVCKYWLSSFSWQEEVKRGIWELVEIPDEYKGIIIGKGGANLREISEQTGAEVSRRRGEVYITNGTEHQREQAKVNIGIKLVRSFSLWNFNLRLDMSHFYFKILSDLRNWLTTYTNSTLHYILVRKAWLPLGRNILLLEAHTSLRTKLEENCKLEGKIYVLGQICTRTILEPHES